MSYGLLVGPSDKIAEWVWKTFRLTPMLVDRAIGIVNQEGKLVGAALFHNYNGCNVEFSYYGPQTASLGIGKAFARVALLDLKVSRVTIMTSKRNKAIVRWLPKIGCKLEGVSRCYYGPVDCMRNTAVRFVLFHDSLVKLAGVEDAECTASRV